MKNKKELGQHWLKNRVILEEIAEATKREYVEFCDNEWKDNEICVEIGPGLGTLTASLFRRFKKITAIEFDPDLARKLPGSFPGKELEVINEDILRFDFLSIKEPYVVAGNIPYYITSPIIEKLLKIEENRPRRIVLLIQKEVAERILDKKETMLSLFVKNRARVLRGPIVKKEEFTPPPKVDSEVIILEPKEPEIGEEVFRLIKRGFISPRKKLAHNLGIEKEKILEIFGELKIDENARPGDLGLGDWGRLHKKIQDELQI